MDVQYFELRAANRQCTDKFTDVAKVRVENVPIFEHACNYVNNSSSYKRNGRKLEIVEIRDYCIIVKLTSDTKLEMASKSLAGFTRELLRVDETLHQEKENRLFTYFLYSNTLFRNKQIDIKEIDQNDTMEMSDTEALKKCVDLFCSSITNSKEAAKRQTEAKNKVKQILLDYLNNQAK